MYFGWNFILLLIPRLYLASIAGDHSLLSYEALLAGVETGGHTESVEFRKQSEGVSYVTMWKTHGHLNDNTNTDLAEVRKSTLMKKVQ